MLVVVSPAKRLDWEPRPFETTTPDFLPEANRLAGHARALTLTKLKSMMSLSDDLARLNRERFRAFQAAPEADNTPALYGSEIDAPIEPAAAPSGPVVLPLPVAPALLVPAPPPSKCGRSRVDDRAARRVALDR